MGKRSVGLLILLIFSIATLVPVTPIVKGNGISSGTPWPMFHQNLAHTGVTSDIVRPPLALAWKQYQAGGSPVVSGGVVYVGSGDNNVYLYAFNASTGVLIWSQNTLNTLSAPAVSGSVVYETAEDGYVYAFNANTGGHIWKHATGSSIISSPAVFGGVVYVGSGDSKVYAFNATTGTSIWNYTTGDSVSSSPAVFGGVVYVGSDDHNVYALNAHTGAKIWSYTTGGSVDSSPAVFGKVVYVGSGDSKVYALNGTTGAFIWSYTTGGGVYSSSAVSGGVVYVGSDDHNVYAFNAHTGAKIWSYTTGKSVRSSPAVSGNILYVGSNDHNVYALNGNTGALIWDYPTDGEISSSPAVSGSMMYVGSDLFALYAFVSPTGPYLFSSVSHGSGSVSPSCQGGCLETVGSLISVTATPDSGWVVANWNITGASCAGGLSSNPCSFSMPNNPVVVSANFHLPTAMTVSYQVNGDGSSYSAPLLNYVQLGVSKQLTLTNAPVAVNADYGSAWSVTNPLQGSTGSERWWTSQPTIGKAYGQTINFMYQHQYRLTMNVNPSNGGKVTPISGWQDSIAPSLIIQASPTDWPMFHQNLQHTGLTPDNVTPPLFLAWSKGVGSWVTSSPAVTGGIVYVGTSGSLVALNATTGTTIWTFSPYVDHFYSSPAVSGGLVYATANDDLRDHYFYALNATTGAQVWNYSMVVSVPCSTDFAWGSSPAVSGGIVYVGSTNGNVYAFNANTGALVWNYTTRCQVYSSPAVSGGKVYVGSGNGDFYAFDAATGHVVWKVNYAPYEDSSPSVVGNLVYISDGALRALDASTGKVVWHQSGGWLSSPAVSGGMVYVGDSNNYVYAYKADTGALVWSYLTGGTYNGPSEVQSSPAVSDGVVYVGTGFDGISGFVYALNATNGASIWNYSTGAGGGVRSSPAVSGGMVFVGSEEGNVYAFAPGILNVSSVNIQATPSANFVFLSWTGSGNGSYSGANNPSTVTMNGAITETANFKQTGGQLSVSLVSPTNGTTVTSPVTLKVKVAGFVQGASITIVLDGGQVCSGSTDSTGAFSCKASVTKTGLSHSWYATASKTGFTSGTSPTWTFTY